MNPSPYMYVDESMIAYNGRFCGFKQYLLAKPITHRIKVFVMCCATTRYVLRWEVYVRTGVNPAAVHHGEGGMVGNSQDLDGEVDDQLLPEQAPPELGHAPAGDDDFVGQPLATKLHVSAEDRAARHTTRLLAKKTGLGIGAAVVNRLTAGLDNMYYTLACDNFFTSLVLFHNLLQRGMYTVGIVRRYQVGFPKSLNVGDNEVCGTLHLRVHGDRFMSAVHWADCKGVAFLFTAANPYEHRYQVQRNVGAEKITLPCTLQQPLYN